MLRLPKRFVDLPALARFLDAVNGVTVRRAGDNVVFDILNGDEDPDEPTWSDDAWDGAGRLAALAPLLNRLTTAGL